MNTLYLPLKKKWYNMIESGEKTEEYREIKYYWIKRFTEINSDSTKDKYQMKKFDTVRFSYGYTKRTMSFNVEKVNIDYGREEWGSPSKSVVFIIKLGKRIN